MEEIGIEQARLMLGDIVDRARFLGQPTQITRHGKPAAVVVSAEFYGAALSHIGQTGSMSRYLNGYEIHHIDGDPRNNDPSNLEVREKS